MYGISYVAYIYIIPNNNKGTRETYICCGLNPED